MPIRSAAAMRLTPISPCTPVTARSQSFFTRGSIFTVIVPATTMTSACRGDARTIVPMRSRSTRLAAAAMSFSSVSVITNALRLRKVKL